MDAVLATIFDGGWTIRRKHKKYYNLINYTVILLFYTKPSVSAFNQLLPMKLPASDWADPQIPRRKYGTSLGGSKTRKPNIFWVLSISNYINI